MEANLTSLNSNADVATIRNRLCQAFCEDINVTEKRGLLRVSVPLTGRDGDRFTVYVERLPAGWRLSDKASTVMRLSYENDLTRLFEGARGKLFDTIIAENHLSHDDGELYINVPADGLIRGLFDLSQGMSRVEDIGLWTRTRTESTFYDDLRRELHNIVSNHSIHEEFVVPGIAGSSNYPIDYSIDSKSRPVYLFGVGSNEKAQLATIVLQYLAAHEHRNHSIIVFSDMEAISKKVAFRLMDNANDIIPSLIGHADVLKRKIEDRIAA